MAFCAALIKADGGASCSGQVRIHWHTAGPFVIYKFRTMTGTGLT